MALQSVKNGKSKCMEMIYEEAKNIDYGAWKMSRSEKIKQLILLKRMNLSIAFLAKIRQLHLHVNKEKVSLRIE